MAVITRTKAKEVLESGYEARVRIGKKEVTSEGKTYFCIDYALVLNVDTRCASSAILLSVDEALDFLFGDKLQIKSDVIYMLMSESYRETKSVQVEVTTDMEKLQQELNSVRKELSDAQKELKTLKSDFSMLEWKKKKVDEEIIQLKAKLYDFMTVKK